MKIKDDVELFDPKIDFCFKRIFGYKDYNFMDFANSVLGLQVSLF